MQTRAPSSIPQAPAGVGFDLPEVVEAPKAGRATHGPTGLLSLAGLLYIFCTPLDVVPTPFGTPAKLAGAVFLLAWAFELLTGTVKIPRAPAILTSLAALVMWEAATVAWSFAPRISLGSALITLQLAISAVAVAGTFTGSMVRPAFAMGLGSALAGAFALLSGPEHTYSETWSIVEQSTFLGVDQNILAFHLCLGFAAATFVIIDSRAMLLRAAASSMALLLFVAIIVVGSRSGIGALVAMCGLIACFKARSVRGLMGAILGISVSILLIRVLAAAGMIPTRIIDWVANPTVTDSRTEIIDAYLVTRSDWVVKGIGIGADADYLYMAASSYRNAHSAFWKVWIETGFIGLVLWGLFLVSMAYRAVRSRSRILFILFLPTILSFFYTLGPLNSNMLWVVFGLALGASPASRSRPGSTRQQPIGDAAGTTHDSMGG